MTKDELIRLRNWVDAKLTKGAEPQWSRRQCVKLRDGLDAILACPGTEYLKKSAARAGVHLPLVGSEDWQDTSSPHRGEQRCICPCDAVQHGAVRHIMSDQSVPLGTKLSATHV